MRIVSLQVPRQALKGLCFISTSMQAVVVGRCGHVHMRPGCAVSDGLAQKSTLCSIACEWHLLKYMYA